MPTPKHQLLNRFGVCVVCRAQSIAIAAGEYPGRLAWFCETCGGELAERILHMKDNKLNKLETDAVMKLLEQFPDRIVIEPEQRVEFIEWIIAEFGNNIRRELDANTPPF